MNKQDLKRHNAILILAMGKYIDYHGDAQTDEEMKLKSECLDAINWSPGEYEGCQGAEHDLTNYNHK